MKKIMNEFKSFINRGSVVDMAVGIMIGAAFKAIVDSLVNDIISPILGLVLQDDFSNVAIKVFGVEIRIGAFLMAILNFFLIAVVLFLIVKLMNGLDSSLKAHFGKKEEEAAKAEQVAKRTELKSQTDEVDSLIKEISSQESVLAQAEQELKAAANAADAEIRRKEKELAAQIANVVSESGFQWPLPAGYNTLTSLFGSRIHPITKKANNHTGIDIPAPGGTAIYAAKSGVVITSVKKGSYGNYVVVSHRDGTSTLYAHMSKRAVSEGATVKQGQVIGYVGTTGSSTGNHLHFEVRVNGTRKDPVNYFKDKTLYVTSGGKKTTLSH